MPDFGVVVTFIILYYGAEDDYPSARWKEEMSPTRCIAAVTQGLLAEAQRHGALADGGTITFGCQLDMPKTTEH